MRAIDCAYAQKASERETCRLAKLITGQPVTTLAMQVIHPPSGPVVHEIPFVCPLCSIDPTVRRDTRNVACVHTQTHTHTHTHLHTTCTHDINIILADFPHSLLYSLLLYLSPSLFYSFSTHSS